MTTRRSPAASLLLVFVWAYQQIPHWGPPRCRFYPSCSEYAMESVRTHGALRGAWLAMRRLGRCHPWNPGGIDYVPARSGQRDRAWKRAATG
ncbi:MAG TPA: membrane protein insertion efficiency factor YidD [Egibacteraceae bacterium]|nr:membrane protein insertion efficiency factor YidD [Egibacteraceae bacterium]